MQFGASALAIVWWMYAARTLTVLLGLLLTGRVGHSGRLLQEGIGAAVFLIAIVAAAGYVLQLPVKGLLANAGASGDSSATDPPLSRLSHSSSSSHTFDVRCNSAARRKSCGEAAGYDGSESDR